MKTKWVFSGRPSGLSTRIGIKLLWLLATLSLLSAALAAETIDDRVRRLSDQLRCPTCQAQSVKESDAGLSVNMRNKIRELIVDGRSDAEIRQFFVERYGDWILRSPPKKGFALFLWVLPGVVILVAGFWLIRYLLRKSKRHQEPRLSPLSTAERQEVEAALKEL